MTPQEIKEAVEKLLAELNDETIENCDDNQCDDETCQLVKALKNYLKYAPKSIHNR